MKIITVDKTIHVILDEGEKVVVTTPQSFCKNALQIENQQQKFILSGNSELVQEIKGESLKEKITDHPTFSKEEILEKCDLWLNEFKKINDLFYAMALVPKYFDKNAYLLLEFSTSSYLSRPNEKRNNIGLSFYKDGKQIQKGIDISIPEENKEIYQYLMTATLSYFLAMNFKGDRISFSSDPGYLWKSTEVKGKYPVRISFAPLLQSKEDTLILKLLIESHNLHCSNDDFINEQKEKITSQKMNQETIKKLEMRKRN